MTFLTMAGWVFAPLLLAFAIRFPWFTLVLVCSTMVVVLPSFNLAMGAWVLAMMVMIGRSTWVAAHHRRGRSRTARTVVVRSTPQRSPLITPRSRSW